MALYESELIQALSAENEPDCYVLRRFVRGLVTLNGHDASEALSLAVRRSFFKSVRILLEAGVLPNIATTYFGKTALHLACIVQSTEIIHELLNYGADVNAKGQYEMTPLHEASIKTNIANITVLLNHGAMVNAVDARGLTSLSLAIDTIHCVSSVQVLLSAGADVDISDQYGLTPLHYAVENNFPQAVHLLLQYKANANIKDNNGNTPLHAATLEQGVPIDIIRELVKGGAWLNSLNNEGDSPLDCAIAFADVEAIKELLRCGASFNIMKCLTSLENSVSQEWRVNDIPAIAQQLILYEFMKNPHSVERTHQQLIQVKVGKLRESSPEWNLVGFQQSCLSEVEELTCVICDCGMSSIWGSINNWENCNCDTCQAILKFLFSGRHTNFSEVFFYKLSKELLLEVTVNLMSYFEFKESKKRVMLNGDCVNEIDCYVSFEDVISFLQSKQSEMAASGFEKYLAFMKGDYSSEISPPDPKRPRVF